MPDRPGEYLADAGLLSQAYQRAARSSLPPFLACSGSTFWFMSLPCTLAKLDAYMEGAYPNGFIPFAQICSMKHSGILPYLRCVVVVHVVASLID
jgi:hypothetical protein